MALEEVGRSGCEQSAMSQVQRNAQKAHCLLKKRCPTRKVVATYLEDGTPKLRSQPECSRVAMPADVWSTGAAFSE